MILLNVGIPSSDDMTASGNTKRRHDVNDLVQAAVRHLDEHRSPAEPFTLEMPLGSPIGDSEELAKFFRFKKWNVVVNGQTLLISWPA